MLALAAIRIWILDSWNKKAKARCNTSGLRRIGIEEGLDIAEASDCL
jgi:hypothetical protein